MKMAAQQDDDFEFKCNLIEEVREWPAIYDKAHPDHCDRIKRDNIWEQIALNLGKDGKFNNKLKFLYCLNLIW